jgi:tRNA (guanine10-N2)-methyltransferase
MDAELSLIMANQALARPGSIILDPFVGTGSFLISCSHFGAFTLGSDIDGRQIKGTGEKTGIQSNISQYSLGNRVLGTLVSDIAHHPWKDGEWFDAIVCDPPYGVRAGAKKIASTNLSPYKKYF